MSFISALFLPVSEFTSHRFSPIGLARFSADLAVVCFSELPKCPLLVFKSLNDDLDKINNKTEMNLNSLRSYIIWLYVCISKHR